MSAPTAAPPPDAAPAEPGSEATLGSALLEQALRLERLIVRAASLIALLGVAISIYLALRVSAPLGVRIGLLSATLGWYWRIADLLLAKGRGLRVFSLVNPLLEGSIATAIVVLDYYTKGPFYAASAPGILLYCLFAPLSVLRLRPYLPVLVGAVGAAQYALVYALLLYPALRAHAPLPPSVGPDMAAVRTLLIAMSGVSGTAVAVALRNAADRANREVRSRELFGKYRLGARIAAGGMGAVFRATYCPEGGFKRPVALKKIHPHLAAQEELVEAFRQEAELCARLLHPNIVQVLDFGRIEDTYFFAMEYIDGGTVADLIRRAQRAKVSVPARLCAFIGREVCRGLAFAHDVARDDEGARLRVVHRDLNPPNVLVSRGGHVKILDFGIAKALRDAENTSTRSASGKVGYMSPEQASGGAIDERCDLYAAAIIVWELLCLEPMFRRDNELATLNALMSEPLPSVTARRPDIAPEWEAFFARALARDLSARFPTAVALAGALDELLAREGVPHPSELQDFLRELPELPERRPASAPRPA